MGLILHGWQNCLHSPSPRCYAKESWFSIVQAPPLLPISTPFLLLVSTSLIFPGLRICPYSPPPKLWTRCATSGLGKPLKLISSCSDLRGTARLSPPPPKLFALAIPFPRTSAADETMEILHQGRFSASRIWFFGGANSMVIPGGISLIEPILPERRPNIVFYPFDRRSGSHTFLLVRNFGVADWSGGWRNSLWRPKFSGRIRALWGRIVEGYGR